MCPFKAFEYKENRISIYDKTQKILVALKTINWGMGCSDLLSEGFTRSRWGFCVLSVFDVLL